MKFKELLALSVVPVGLFAGTQHGAQTHSTPHDASHKNVDMTQTMKEEPGVGLSVFGDYLYWKPYFSNLPYAIDYPFLHPENVNTAANGTNWDTNGVLTQKFVNTNFVFSGDSAFRIGAHYQSDWQTFGMGVEWTSFNSSDTNRRTDMSAVENADTTVNNGNAIAPWWASQINTFGTDISTDGVPFATKATTTIKLNFVDYMVNTEYTPVSWMKLVPSLAIRTLYSSMNFRQITNYNTNQVTSAGAVAAPPYLTTTDNNNQKFNSVGIMGGMQTNFCLYDGLSLFAGAQFSYNAGSMQVTRKTDSSVGNQVVIYGSQKSQQDTFLPVTDTELGLQYAWADDENNFGIMMQAAYEMHYLPKFQNFIYQQSAMNVAHFPQQAIRYTGDLSIQGLRLRAGFAF